VECKRGKKPQRHLTVKVTYISVPGAEVRLAQAMDLLLKSAAMNTTKFRDNANSDNEESSHQGAVQDMPTNSESKPLDTFNS